LRGAKLLKHTVYERSNGKNRNGLYVKVDKIKTEDEKWRLIRMLSDYTIEDPDVKLSDMISSGVKVPYIPKGEWDFYDAVSIL